MNGADVPTRYQKMYDRAMAGNSKLAAIRAHCAMCMGWRSADVPTCTATTCPLFPYRCRSPRTSKSAKARSTPTPTRDTPGNENEPLTPQ
jgi:hypothetical protein